MLRSSYIGDATAGVGSAGPVVFATANPGGSHVALDAGITEHQVADLRKAGGISRRPMVGLRGVAAFSNPHGIVGWPPARVYMAIGNGLTMRASNVPFDSGGGTQASVIHASIAAQQPVNSALFTDVLASLSPVGLSFAHGEFHLCTDRGLYSAALTPTATPAATGRGAGHIAGSAAYDQVRWMAGLYVAFCSAGGVPKYSGDRVIWTSCTLPVLNADAGAAGNAIVWIEPTVRNERLLAITAYGEILQSLDGITFTKTYARAAGGVTQGLGHFVHTSTGKLFATGSALANGQVFAAAGETAGFGVQALAIAGKTFASPARGVGYTGGVLGIAFGSTPATSNVACALSVDDGATFAFGSGGDGTQNGDADSQFACLAAEGVIMMLELVPVSGVLTGNTFMTDAGPLLAARYFHFTDAPSGVAAKPYLKVS